ncbi:MAG: conjugal transfer protein TraX [Coriobacteriia bacterium]|nr:conjugal transfer protein TraX [Coriobacteriia bacterium]MBS5477648.1 conjugal transfer protein TraX [Coriobacteriia bacterium]
MAQATKHAPSAAALAERDRRWQFLTSYAIKWIAIVTMVLDHVAAIVIWQVYGDVYRSGARLDAQGWYDLYLLMRHIGRVAFPLFCFLLAEGFAHTHSKPKYAWRLFLFALISEWPYDWALYGTGLEFTRHQNVMFTLLVSFLALWAGEALGGLIDRAIARGRTGAHSDLAANGNSLGTNSASRSLTPVVVIATIVFILLGAWFADITEMSYHAFGVLLPGALYLARRSRVLQVALGCALVAWYCWDHGGDLFESYAVIGLLLLFLYNGKRGRSMKWFFYVFYPAHMLIIGVIAQLMG